MHKSLDDPSATDICRPHSELGPQNPVRGVEMKIISHSDFHEVYTSDPAAAPGRIEAILKVVEAENTPVEAVPAPAEAIASVHTQIHIQNVIHEGLYDMAALAAGGAVQAATIGLAEPCFALVRPPGHHAHADHAWGFCYFNNMAVAIDHLSSTGKIHSAHILDFDLHYGDGTASILAERGSVTIHNPRAGDRRAYLEEVASQLVASDAEIIGVSAGFDNHRADWGGLLETEDYRSMGRMVHEHCQRLGCGCFAVLEGGYNHAVLGDAVRAFVKGLEGL
jgi:acetoin utilization deacetylase AcuC-like enzyme